MSLNRYGKYVFEKKKKIYRADKFINLRKETDLDRFLKILRLLWLTPIRYFRNFAKEKITKIFLINRVFILKELSLSLSLFLLALKRYYLLQTTPSIPGYHGFPYHKYFSIQKLSPNTFKLIQSDAWLIRIHWVYRYNSFNLFSIIRA